MARRAELHVTTDHDEIRGWAEERDARPACVRGTGGDGDVGILRLDFPGYSGEESLEPISWDDWFRKFDQTGLALLYEEKTAGGEKSNFNKLISHKTAEAALKREKGAGRATRRASASRSTRTAGARGRSAKSARVSSRTTASTRGSTSRGKAKASPRTRATRSARGASSVRVSSKRTQRTSTQKKTSRRASSQSRNRRKAA